MEFKLSFKTGDDIEKDWDVIIIGGGPAGLTAALYCGRYKLKTLVITKEVGGLLLEASIIEDYPGIKSIKGSELAKLFKEHAEEWGAKIILDEVVDIKKTNERFQVITRGGSQFESKALIVATGSQRRKLDVPGIDLPGVSYCAECDAPLYKDKVVGVVGGGNSAFHDALVLAQHAKKVYLIHRRGEFRADPIIVEEAKKNPKIEFLLNKVVTEIKGEKKVEKIVLKDVKNGETFELDLDGLFIAIGLVPVTEIVKRLGVKIDEYGHIIVNDCTETNVKGLFAAGDVTTQICNFRQVLTAAAQGAVAALNAFRYVKGLK